MTMLFEPLATPSLQLANRAIMAPMTRSRAVDANTPNTLMAEYYGQRATAGLIITEGTSPSPNGLGYPRIPGLFNEAQGSFILAGGFDRASAESALKADQADLIAFARPFLANPDLVERMRANAALNAVDMATFYTPGPRGYTDYQALAT
jgi:2,4-dienoyl-CoA reductase-like NADH-dependent reductase (Old Yellow Enzyme family)